MASSATTGVIPRAHWPAVLSDTATEVFSMMVGAQIAPAIDGSALPQSNVTGTVGIAGALRAVFSFRCSIDAAGKIASGMLCIPIEQAEAQKWDAVGEMSNIMAGLFKAKIGLEAQCMLSVPTVVAGNDYQIHTLAEGEHIELPFAYEGETVLIALEIRK